MPPRPALLAAPFLALLLAGCAAPAPRATLASPAAATLSADLIYIPGSPTREFSGGRAGSKPRPQRRSQAAADDQGRWVVTMSAPDKSGAWSPIRTVLLQRDADGTVRMVQVTDAAEKTTTHFVPPLALMPAVLAPERPFSDQSTVQVARISDGQIIERGTAQTLAELVGHQPGPPAVFEWRSTLTMQLSAAKVLKVSIQTVQADRGVIAEHESLNVTVGPFTVRSSEESWTIAP